LTCNFNDLELGQFKDHPGSKFIVSKESPMVVFISQHCISHRIRGI